MGLFDAFDPATYQSPQGGLADRILAAYAAAPPQAVDASAPMNANAAMPAPAPSAPAPQQASSIDVGGYSMPRIGPAAAFTLPPGRLNPMTGEHELDAPVAPVQPTAGTIPNLPAAPFDAAGDHLKAAWQSMRHGGGLIGGLAGLITGQRDDPANDVQQQQATQAQRAYTALVNAGMPARTAQAAVLGGPDVAKALIERQFGPQTVTPLGQGYVADKNGNVRRAYTPEQNDSYSVVPVGEDGLGNKTFAKMNKATGEMAPIAAPGGGGNASNALGDPNATGEAYLKTLPPDIAGRVKAVAEGRQPYPGSLAAGRPYWRGITAAVEQYDPSFDGSQWVSRNAGQKDFTSGKSSEMVRSANQVLGHLSTLVDKADALNNGNYPALNAAENYVGSNVLGHPAVTGFNQAANAVADELGKIYKGAGLSDHEIEAWKANLSPNASPAQQREAISTAGTLLDHALAALEEKRASSIGQMAADKAGPLLKPDAQAAFDKIQKWAKGNAAATGGTAPTGVKWSVVQ